MLSLKKEKTTMIDERPVAIHCANVTRCHLNWLHFEWRTCSSSRILKFVVKKYNTHNALQKIPPIRDAVSKVHLKSSAHSPESNVKYTIESPNDIKHCKSITKPISYDVIHNITNFDLKQKKYFKNIQNWILKWGKELQSHAELWQYNYI